jgi:hypothetical protein
MAGRAAPAGVGGDHLWPDAGRVGQQPVENMQTVALGAGNQVLGEYGVVSAIHEYSVEPCCRPK